MHLKILLPLFVLFTIISFGQFEIEDPKIISDEKIKSLHIKSVSTHNSEGIEISIKEYDVHGNLTYEKGGLSSEESDYRANKYTNEYDSKERVTSIKRDGIHIFHFAQKRILKLENNKIKLIDYDIPLDQLTMGFIEEYTYNTFGEIDNRKIYYKENLEKEFFKIDYHYSANQQLDSVSTSFLGREEVITFLTKYFQYDKKGKLIATIEKTMIGDTIQIETFNSQGKIESKKYNANYFTPNDYLFSAKVYFYFVKEKQTPLDLIIVFNNFYKSNKKKIESIIRKKNLNKGIEDQENSEGEETLYEEDFSYANRFRFLLDQDYHYQDGMLSKVVNKAEGITWVYNKKGQLNFLIQEKRNKSNINSIDTLFRAELVSETNTGYTQNLKLQNSNDHVINSEDNSIAEGVIAFNIANYSERKISIKKFDYTVENQVTQKTFEYDEEKKSYSEKPYGERIQYLKASGRVFKETEMFENNDEDGKVMSVDELTTEIDENGKRKYLETNENSKQIKDAQGRIQKIISYSDKAKTRAVSETIYTYKADGNYSCQVKNLGEEYSTGFSIYHFDSHSNLVLIENKGGEENSNEFKKYTYDDKNNLVKIQEGIKEGQTEEIEKEIIYTYNELGLWIKMTNSNPYEYELDFAENVYTFW